MGYTKVIISLAAAVSITAASLPAYAAGTGDNGSAIKPEVCRLEGNLEEVMNSEKDETEDPDPAETEDAAWNEEDGQEESEEIDAEEAEDSDWEEIQDADWEEAEDADWEEAEDADWGEPDADVYEEQSMCDAERPEEAYCAQEETSAAEEPSEEAAISESQDGVSTDVKADCAKNSAGKIDYANAKDRAVAGSYIAAENMNLRAGAGESKRILAQVKKNVQVRCYGYYTETNGEKWLYVQYIHDGIAETGFCNSVCLK